MGWAHPRRARGVFSAWGVPLCAWGVLCTARGLQGAALRTARFLHGAAFAQRIPAQRIPAWVRASCMDAPYTEHPLSWSVLYVVSPFAWSIPLHSVPLHDAHFAQKKAHETCLVHSVSLCRSIPLHSVPVPSVSLCMICPCAQRPCARCVPLHDASLCTVSLCMACPCARCVPLHSVPLHDVSLCTASLCMMCPCAQCTLRRAYILHGAPCTVQPHTTGHAASPGGAQAAPMQRPPWHRHFHVLH